MNKKIQEWAEKQNARNNTIRERLTEEGHYATCPSCGSRAAWKTPSNTINCTRCGNRKNAGRMV